MGRRGAIAHQERGLGQQGGFAAKPVPSDGACTWERTARSSGRARVPAHRRGLCEPRRAGARPAPPGAACPSGTRPGRCPGPLLPGVASWPGRPQAVADTHMRPGAASPDRASSSDALRAQAARHPLLRGVIRPRPARGRCACLRAPAARARASCPPAIPSALCRQPIHRVGQPTVWGNAWTEHGPRPSGRGPNALCPRGSGKCQR